MRLSIAGLVLVGSFVVAGCGGGGGEDADSGSSDPRTHQVSTSAGTGGSISPSSRSVAHGEPATFEVTSNSGFAVASVTGCDGCLDGATYTTGAITGPCTVSAEFSAISPASIDLNLYKSGSSNGTLLVSTDHTDDQMCGTVCDHLHIELPVGTLVTLEADPSPGAVLWSWGILPCEHLSGTCQFVLEEDFEGSISFESAVVQSSTIAVPAHEEYEYVDTSAGVRLKVPAEATHQATTLRLEIATNEVGERNVFVELIDPAAWNEGLHRLSISFDEPVLPFALTPQGIMRIGERSLSTEIYPLQRYVPYVSYNTRLPWDSRLRLWRVENRLQPLEHVDCPQYIEIVKSHGVWFAERRTSCGEREHAVATARCSTEPSGKGVCPADAWPVILVHGYSRGEGYLDPHFLASSKADYWGDLPYALYIDGYAPYALRWNTAQRFEDAASSLREVAERIRELHQGKPPVIVAHSFGGLVARVYAQGQDNTRGATAPSTSDILGLVTIGTPHSGISSGGVISGQLYPDGADPDSPAAFLMNRCLQISCYQAGRDVDFFTFFGSNLDLREYVFGVKPYAGETVRRLGYPYAFEGQSTRVPLQVLLGLQHGQGFENYGFYLRGDGLISWQGQRAHPSLSCGLEGCEDRPLGEAKSLQTDFPEVFGNTVTERLLGYLDAVGVMPKPGETIASGSSVPYAHTRSSSNQKITLGARSQTGIKRDWDVDVDPRRHDVLLAVLETVGEWTGEAPPPPISTGALNDTGIDWCADGSTNFLTCPVAGYPGQDGDLGRDAAARAGTLQKVGAGDAGFDYTKISNSGSELPASATLGSGPNDWACTRDNVTGLIWEVKTADGGLRDRNNTYTWYQPDGPNMGNPGTQDGGSCVGSTCDTHGFVQAVNGQGLCGATDWRLPAVGELSSIVHHGRTRPAVDAGFFPNIISLDSAWFWSASPAPLAPDAAWDLLFNYGNEGLGPKSNLGRVRLVRGGQ